MGLTFLICRIRGTTCLPLTSSISFQTNEKPKDSFSPFRGLKQMIGIVVFASTPVFNQSIPGPLSKIEFNEMFCNFLKSLKITVHSKVAAYNNLEILNASVKTYYCVMINCEVSRNFKWLFTFLNKCQPHISVCSLKLEGGGVNDIHMKDVKSVIHHSFDKAWVVIESWMVFLWVDGVEYNICLWGCTLIFSQCLPSCFNTFWGLHKGSKGYKGIN